MVHPDASEDIQDFLGSACFFASAVEELLTEQLAVAGGRDLTLSQLKLMKLIALAEADHLIMRDVAAFLGVSNAAASKSVDKLVRRGLLDRAPAVEDRRAVRLDLTEAGRSLLHRFEHVANRVLDRVFQPLNEEQLHDVRALLDQISLRVLASETTPRRVCFQCGIFFREDCLLRQAHGRRCHYHVQQEAKARRT